jgi:hypothetical protein
LGGNGGRRRGLDVDVVVGRDEVDADIIDDAYRMVSFSCGAVVAVP